MQSRILLFKARGGWLISFLLCAVETRAGDWPQFLGPARNGACAATNLADTWPKEGPPIVWRKKIGQGFSGPSVAAGKLVLFHRLDSQETVECLDASNG